MTIDVNLTTADEAFIDEIDEIIEDTMIQIFFLHPKEKNEIETVQSLCQEHTSLFYSLPIEQSDQNDQNCIGYTVNNTKVLKNHSNPNKPLFVYETDLDGDLQNVLKEKSYQGVILDATKTYQELPNFLLSLGENSIAQFDSSDLGSISMDRITLHSRYPEYDFDGITTTVKTISDVMFRPEQSIIARATKSTLTLFGFKK